MKRYVLALDQGTTSSRAIVFAADGRIVSAVSREFPQILPLQFDLPTQVVDLGQTALPDPQAILQPDEQQKQDAYQDAH